MSLLCPSMMCANFENLKECIEELDQAGVDCFHCDVMDGSFVDNFALGMYDIETICKHTNKMVDVHLMMENPSKKVDWFIKAGVDLIYIHPEAERYVIKTLLHIKEQHIKCGIALNPDTSVSTVKEMLPLCDYILIMSVNPGFAGQKFIPTVEEKIRELIKLKEKYSYKLILDGSCSEDIIAQYSALGIDGFVLGTSALFKPNINIQKQLQYLKTL